MAMMNRVSVLAMILNGLCACDGPGEDRPDLGRDLGVDQTIADSSPLDQRRQDRAPGDAPSPDKGPSSHAPVVMVHGVNGSSANYKVMIQRLVADGWPKGQLFTIDFPDPKWGCNLANAKIVEAVVKQVLIKTGASRVDLVAHSMGTLSTRYFMKNLGGHKMVDTYVTLGGMHHGLRSPCLSPLDVCVWKELCATGPFITQLNKAPATPGKCRWVSIHGTADTTVPNASSKLVGAENIQLKGVAHAGAQGLLEHQEAYKHVKRVLQYPPWK